MRYEISVLFGNTLNAGLIYSRHNSDNFPQHVQAPLSEKEKPFFKIFIPFLESTQSFPHFWKKDQLHTLNTWEVIESKKCGYLNARILLFQNTLQESTCSRVPNTAEVSTAAPSS